MNYSRILLAILCIFTQSTTVADQVEPVRFSHHDWELVCDNTRTCRAAGYHAEGDTNVVSVLLTRKAGPHQPVTGQLTLGDIDDGQTQPSPSTLTLRINGIEHGPITLNWDGDGELSAGQVAELTRTLPGNSRIEFLSGDQRWRLSDRGASAVLLKMDEAQGRIDTPGALVRKGNRAESSVLPTLPVPVIEVPSLKGFTAPVFSGNERRQLIGALRKNSGDDCDRLLEADNNDVALSIEPLDESRSLVDTDCWLAAYNGGSGFWIIRNQPPFDPVFITDSGTDYADGVIVASHKGRGFGDCWSSESWAWNGQRFVSAGASSTGMCRAVRAGGTWNLPRYVADVRTAPASNDSSNVSHDDEDFSFSE